MLNTTKSTVTITIPVEFDGVDPSQFADMGVALSDPGYSDGRYDFFWEMLEHALAKCLYSAAKHSLFEINEKKYEGQRVPHFDDKGEVNGWTSRPYLETEKDMEKVHVYFNMDRLQGKVEDAT